MSQTYMVRWNDNGARGFSSIKAAQQYIDRVCMLTAPHHEYIIELEF